MRQPFRPRGLRLVVFGCLVGIPAVLCCFAPPGPAKPAENPTPGRALYHADPRHLWNRLHEALFVRVGPDGRAYGQDRLEPLLWRGTKHLLEAQSRDRAVAVLKEFLRSKGERLIEDPLKRAVLQRDLWLVFNWLQADHDLFASQLRPEEWRASQQRLRRPLAQVIGRLALRPDQIKHLPDNYAAAVASGRFARGFDSGHPDKPFLPPDLFAADGPWVCVGRPDGPVAPAHLAEGGGNAFTNSTFLVFLRLPAGRAATLDYLSRLRSFKQPLLVLAEGGGRHGEKYLPNAKLPRFPVGTQAALVRRALLVAAPHTVMASPLTESVQLRVYREIPALTRESLDASLGGGTAANRRAEANWQSFQEFRLSRSRLFARQTGGLRAVGRDERDFKTGFSSYPFDEFEGSPANGRSFPNANRLPVTVGSCFGCHSLPGVYSFNSYFNFRVANRRDGDDRRPAALAEMAPAEVDRSAVRWKRGRPSWASLEDLLAK